MKFKINSVCLHGSRTIFSEENNPQNNCHLDDCLLIISPWTTALEENCPPSKNCPLTIKSSKIIAATQANSPQRVLRVN